MRVTLLSIAMALLSWPAHAVDGYNQPGYSNSNGEARCQPSTWFKPFIQAAGGNCWQRRGHDNVSARDAKAEDRTDRPGMDYKNFMTDSWSMCEAACAGDEKCAAWSYVRRGIQGPRGRCWLKSGVPHAVSDATTVSGVKD